MRETNSKVAVNVADPNSLMKTARTLNLLIKAYHRIMYKEDLKIT